MKLNNAELDNYFCKIAYLIVRNIVHYRNVIAEKDRQIALKTEEQMTNKINEQNRRTAEKETKRINKINEQNRRTEEKETKRINKKRRDFENRRIKLTKAFEKLYKKKQIATYNSLKIQSKK